MPVRELGRAGGNPLAKPASSGGMTTYTEVLITSGSGTYKPAAGFTSMRVTAVGAGASGATRGSNSGAGGGCAISPVVAPSTITYSVGVGGLAGTDDGSSYIPQQPGTNTTATFGAVSLSANASVGGYSPGGDSTGGAANYSGGTGFNGGGGAGGTTSNGGNGNTASTGNGGGGGANPGSSTYGGGGGIGARGGHDGAYYGKEPATQAWGSPGNGKNGGWPGGGGGAATAGKGGDGANGGIRIELW